MYVKHTETLFETGRPDGNVYDNGLRAYVEARYLGSDLDLAA